MKHLNPELAQLLTSFGARPSEPVTPFRVVPDVTPDKLAVLRIEGRCGCANGWTFVTGADGYSRASSCPTCGPARDHAARFNAARLPAWAHEVRTGWREDIAPHGAAADLAARLLARRESGRTYHGGTGRGKSWRACAVALAWLDAGGSMTWLTWPAFVNHLRNRLAAGDGIGEATGRPLQSPLLVIDEMAGGQDTPFAREVAERMVSERAESLAPLILTTNKAPAELRDYIGDRAWSRLAPYRVTEVTGVDLRAEGTA